jgi:hypothetical protein
MTLQCLKNETYFVSRFGTGFLFVTASFDDKNHIFAIRLATPSTSNSAFPARDNGFRACMEDCSPSFKDAEFQLPITDTDLLKLISASPVAAAQFFRTLFEAFLYILVGLPPPEQQKEVPINHPSRSGVWSIVTDISIVHETSGRYVYIYYLFILFGFEPDTCSVQRLPAFSHNIGWGFITVSASNGVALTNVSEGTRKGI